MKEYKTFYPNQVHQLAVSVSKNYYVTKTGILKYQKKKMEVDLKNLKSSDKIHLIHYLIKDHTSGLFYAEISTSEEVKEIKGFLHRAWSLKSNFSFQGIPEFLSLPKTIREHYPSILEELEVFGVKAEKPTSGFHAGIGVTKEIENHLVFHIDNPILEAYGAPEKACRTNDKRKFRTGKLTKLEKWKETVKEIRLPQTI